MLKTMHVALLHPSGCSAASAGGRWTLAGEAFRAVRELAVSERSKGVSSAAVVDVAELSLSPFRRRSMSAMFVDRFRAFRLCRGGGVMRPNERVS